MTTNGVASLPHIGDLNGKVALITGASGGLGQAIALAYAAAGAYVVCADLRPEPPKSSPSTETTHDLLNSKFPSQSKPRAVYTGCDVTNGAQVEATVKKAVETYGRLDVLVANAGVTASAGKTFLHETPDEIWDLGMGVNGKGVWLSCKYAIKQMLEQPPHASGDRGWIITLSSIYGVMGAQKSSVYCASKGAVMNMTKAIALEYAQDRIHVNSIHPGFTDTTMLNVVREMTGGEEMMKVVEKLHPFAGGRVGKPEEIGKMAVFLAGDGASWITGQQFIVDGGFTVGKT